MTDERRTIYDVEEGKIEFISQYLVDICKAIDPTLNESNLKGRITALELEHEQYYYILDQKIPLLFVDLNLLIDGT